MGFKARAGDHPFLFVGAGDAGYFEWADIYVYFVEPPGPAERAAIAKLVPPPYAETIEWDGNILYCSSGQFVNLLIASSYESTDGEPEPSDFFGMTPTTSQLDAFEKDTVRFLREAHERSPIAFALRREDFEAGGIELDAWHDWSARQIPERVLPLLERFLGDEPQSSTGSYLLGYAIDMVPKGARRRVASDFILWAKSSA